MRQPKDISRSEMEKLIYEWISGRNAERNRAVMSARLFEGLTYERLAEDYGLSVSQIKRILAKGMETVSRHMR